MRRREFITALLGGAAAAGPLAAGAQESNRLRRIGALMSFAESDPEGQARIAAFRESLQSLGCIEGRNINVEVRWATSAESIRQFAKELAALQPELILSATTPTTASLRQQTLVIPIVFANVSDPVGSGFVVSLSHPGGNTTGFINLEDSMAGKWLGLLKEIAPQASEVLFLFNPTTAPYAEYYLNPFKTAAQSLGVGATAMPVSNSSGLESAFAGQARDLKGGLIVMPDSFRRTPALAHFSMKFGNLWQSVSTWIVKLSLHPSLSRRSIIRSRSASQSLLRAKVPKRHAINFHRRLTLQRPCLKCNMRVFNFDEKVASCIIV